MPRIEIVLDGDRILEELIRLQGINPEARLFAAGELDEEDAVAVRGVARNLFSKAFDVATQVLVTELGFEEDEFEKVTGFVGEFDQNRLPFNIDIWATDRLVWYDSEEAMRSGDREIREAKLNRIVRAIADSLHQFILETFGVNWEVNCWPHLTGGVYYQTS